jgi:hypothetical protein
MEKDVLDSFWGHLQDYTPKNSTNLVMKSSVKVEEMRRSIIHKARIVSLYRFYTRLPIDSFNEATKKAQFHRLFVCNAEGTFPGISQLSQNAAFLVSFLIENPDCFAQTVLSRVQSPDFDVLVMSTIPSVFAFFSSDEQLKNAFAFYCEIARQSKASDCVRIPEPFSIRSRLSDFLSMLWRGFATDFSWT